MVDLVLPVTHFLLLLLLICYDPTTSSTVAGGEVPFYEDCDPDTAGGTYAQNSTYRSNLAALAAELVKNSTGYGSAAGSFGAAPDAVYGVALCRGDSTGAYCSEHLGQVFDDVMNRSSPGSPGSRSRCVLHKNVSLYYDRFQLRLSDRDFVSGYGNEPEWPLNNTNLVNSSVAGRFREHVAELLNATAADAAQQPDRYGTGDSWFQEESTMVYALLQCTRDMAPGRCLACLRRIISEMPRMLDASQFGGRVLGVRCLLRYEMASNSFFHIDNRTLHLQKQPNPKAWPWAVIVAVAGVAAWLMWRDGRWHELIDRCLGDGGRHGASIKRCVQVALLCVQEDAEDRPAMDDVVKMLINEQAILPEPGQSAYFNIRPSAGAGADAPSSACSISISMITPR
ncbi:hypothetical protein ABZP36_002445 [Zizania latifolia]